MTETETQAMMKSQAPPHTARSAQEAEELRGGPPEADVGTFQMIPRRRYGRWVGAALILWLFVLVVNSLARNPRMEWGVVREYFFSTSVVTGLLHTLNLTFWIMVLGILLGTVLAIMRHSGNPVLVAVASFYVWVVRSLPPLVQLLIWYNLAAVYPEITVDLPIVGQVFSGSANDFITPFTAALLALGLNEGAYMGEIIRSGISSVDPGQVEAAKGLGFSGAKTMRRVILPQSLRVIIPPTGNELITVLKVTSLVSIISMTDLLYSVQLIYSKTFQTIPLLVVACIWYLIVTSFLAVFQGTLERRLAPERTVGTTTWSQRMLSGVNRLTAVSGRAGRRSDEGGSK
ncbi:amino acid ABC transporter permease [Pseudactinotalea sp. HY158]|uniref:amino acid ABC transporter permease n=1 Tax=Pseudactinotalea sp. HY158 TaxID=2654547 RepID=UPI00129CDD63|nr:amino acid ABC transporter permease [Pseudactinotalea sp. HY158]QGH70715.1 ABC transporter permease subunit [Pseudactinotalea sp. HY158]